MTWQKAEPMGEHNGIAYSRMPAAPVGRARFELPMSLDPGAEIYLHLFTAVVAGGGTIEPA